MATRINQETSLKLTFPGGIGTDGEDTVSVKTFSAFDAKLKDSDLLAVAEGLAGLCGEAAQGMYRVDTCALRAA